MTALYSILHFLVDGVCAFAMFGYFASWESWYVNVLLYNFCAFAMQMPLGVVLDGLCEKAKGRESKYPSSFVFAVLGVILTLAGAFTHPVVLGLGNALFHLGGGVGTIHEDEGKGWCGRGLGVFVAPGALGLYIGTQWAKNVGMHDQAWNAGLAGTNVRTWSMESIGMPVWTWMILVGVVMLLCLEWGAQVLRRQIRSQKAANNESQESGSRSWSQEATDVGQRETVGGRNVPSTPEKHTLWLMLGCVAVVIFRSYIGMAVSFPWKTTLLAGTIAVLAVVFGKVAGGFAAASFGTRRTVVVSLGLAAICYLFSGNMVAGVIGLFLFNMTMPITLYLLVRKLRNMPGFAFGLLTFALFLGFLPVYLGVSDPADGPILGCVGSLASLVVLWLCVKSVDKKSCAPEAYNLLEMTGQVRKSEED